MATNPRSELVRTEILHQCYGFRPGARDAERMARFARKEGELTDALPAEFEIEADYLADKGLIELVRDDIARSHKRWKITSEGIDYMEEQGFAT